MNGKQVNKTAEPQKAGASYQLASEIFVQGLAGDPANREFMARHNRTIQFEVDGEKPFIVDVRDGKVTLREGVCADPDLGVKASPEVFRQVFRGLMSPGEAWMDDKWWVGGAFSDYVGTSWMMRLIKAGIRSRMQQIW